jgi:hypothetical protein
MTDVLFEQAVEDLRRVRARHPDWRLGQLVANIAMFARGPVESAVWDVEDAELSAAAKGHLETHSGQNLEVSPE